MKYCEHCGKEMLDEAVFCVNCGRSILPVNNNMRKGIDTSVSEGLLVLSVFVPLFGFIYWAAKAHTRPNCAKACGIAATIAFALYLAIAVFASAVEAGVFR